MTREDCFGLAFMAYFALVVSLGVGIFAWGATGLAVLIVVALAIPFLALLSLAIATAQEDADEEA